MNIHRKGKTGCEVLIDHFTNVCARSSFSIQILEKLPGNGYKNGSIDAQMRKYRLEREDYWIKTLRTVYPYGLNDRAKSINSDIPVGKLFPPLPRHGNKFNKHVLLEILHHLILILICYSSKSPTLLFLNVVTHVGNC